MKTIRTISVLVVFAVTSVMVPAQNYPDEFLGLPGNNLNLYAVMNLFQESETLEAFERELSNKKTISSSGQTKCRGNLLYADREQQ